jgi:molybdopterin-containing oxidoreductase family iron-sulfur binding subunit
VSDAELFDQIAKVASDATSILVLSCGHDPERPRIEREGPTVRLRVPCVQLVSDDLLLWAIAAGASGVVVDGTASCPNLPHVGPRRAVAIADAVLRAQGEGRAWVAYEDRALAAVLPEVPARPVAPDAAACGILQTFVADRISRRAHLLQVLGVRDGVPGGPVPPAAPWREVAIHDGACTSCGACALICPTSALTLEAGAEAIRFAGQRCIACGLCEHACPENALTLAPVIPSAHPEPRVLHRARMAPCPRCGEPVAPEASLARIAALLGPTGAAVGEALRLCEPCKLASLVFDAPARGSGAPIEAREDTERVPAPFGSPPAPIDRRGFLHASARAVLGAAALATLTGCGSKRGEAQVRWGMVIDLKRCVGCKACTIACKAENHTPPGVAYNVVMEEEVGEYPNVSRRFLPRPCMQCANSSCTLVCPTGATYHRPDGIVAIDYDKCIGCRYCIAACPYGARSFDYGHNYADDLTPHEKQPSPEYGQYRTREPGKSPIGNVRKCTFCLHRLANALNPACAETCIGHAIHFGNLADPDARCRIHGEKLRELLASRYSMRLKEDLGNEPAVYYLT